MNWFFGNSAGLKFLKDSTIGVTNYNLSAAEGCASISTENGNLLYYSDGISLIDSNNLIISGGLNAYNSSSQGVIFSSSNNLSFLTTTNPSKGFWLYELGVDSLIYKVKLLPKCSESQASILHQNNNDIWITTHSLDSNYFSFLISERSQEMICPIINTVGLLNNGSLTLSSGVIDYNVITNHIYTTTWRLNSIVRSSFDRETAIFSNHLSLPHYSPSRIEISPSGNILYVVDDAQHIHQYDISDIDSTKILNSKTLIATSNTKFGGMQLGNDGKIYVSTNGQQYLAVINKPDILGPGCLYKYDGISLNGRTSTFALPSFNASYFYTPSIDFAYTEDCWGHSYSFEGRDTLGATNFLWKFVAVNSSQSIVKSGKNCVFTFPDTGKWEVSHIASTATRSDTVTKTLTIRPKWKQDVLGRDTFYCVPFPPKGGRADTAHFALNLVAPPNMHCVHWNEEEPNLDETLGPIVDYDHFHSDTLRVDTAGTYIVKLTNKTFCQMYDTLVVEEKPRPNKSVISRVDNQLTSSISAAEYRWYYNGKLKYQTQVQTQIPDSNGYWQVQLVSEYGCESELSDSIYVGFASIRDVRLETLEFRLFPNPSDGNISIEVPKEGVYQIQITDMNGKLIQNSEQDLHSESVKLKLNLAPGSYIITLTDENGQSGSKQITINQ
jgi:hypothetical protein